MRVDGGRINGDVPAAMPSAGDARSLAALFLAAKIAHHIGLTLEDGELQGAVENLIKQVGDKPVPTNFDQVAQYALDATAEFQKRRHFDVPDEPVVMRNGAPK